jgi:hypothetical protein
VGCINQMSLIKFYFCLAEVILFFSELFLD